MTNHGTALSDDTIIRVDRSTPVVYPHYWWLKNVAHPEFQAKGPPEYDLATVELWLQRTGEGSQGRRQSHQRPEERPWGNRQPHLRASAKKQYAR